MSLFQTLRCNQGEKASTTLLLCQSMSLFQTFRCNQGEKASTKIACMPNHVPISNFEMQPRRKGFNKDCFYVKTCPYFKLCDATRAKRLQRRLLLCQNMSLFQTFRCIQCEKASKKIVCMSNHVPISNFEMPPGRKGFKLRTSRLRTRRLRTRRLRTAD